MSSGTDLDYSVNYSNYTAEQCLNLDTGAEQQVTCSSQHLNVTDPPSNYTYTSYPTLWQPVTCYLYNVTYRDRVDMPQNFNYCTVPLTGYDAFLFASLALILGVMLIGKLSAVALMIAGGILGVANYYWNMLSISNSVALWLNIQPASLFFYAFLPPLIMDSTLNLDMFMFKKLWVHSLLLAFIMVFITCAVVAPFIVFAMGFGDRGWSWVQAALFAAIIAPTDCVSVSAILKSSGGPEKLIVLLESESLWNDATAFTLYEIFSRILINNYNDCLENIDCETIVEQSAWSLIPQIISDTVILSLIGIGIGLGSSVITRWLMMWSRWRGAKPYVESTFILAMAYLTFYVTNSPAHGSGVIAVVVFGLYGNATSKWGMLSSEEYHIQFDAAWAMIAFAINSLVFFWSGVSAVNFVIRSSVLLIKDAWSFAAIPIVFVGMWVLRIACIFLFAPFYKLAKAPLTWQEMLFCGCAGLRGSVSLMLIAALTTSNNLFQGGGGPDDVIYSTIAIWTATFVFLTLLINAPLLSPIMTYLSLDRISIEKKKTRAKARRALLRFTEEAIQNLKDDDDEFLNGADWMTVRAYVDMSKELGEFEPAVDDDAEKEVGKKKKEGEKKKQGTGDDTDDVVRGPVSFVGVQQLMNRVLIKTATAKPSSLLVGGGGGGMRGSGTTTTSSNNNNVDLGRQQYTSEAADAAALDSSPFVIDDGGNEGGNDDNDDDVISWHSDMSASELIAEMQGECMWLGDKKKKNKEKNKGARDTDRDSKVGDVEMGLPPESSNNNNINSTTIDALNDNATSDQVFSGSRAARLSLQLQQHLAQEAASPPEKDGLTEGEVFCYSMPAGVGQRLKEQLATHLADADKPASKKSRRPAGLPLPLPLPSSSKQKQEQEPSSSSSLSSIHIGGDAVKQPSRLQKSSAVLGNWDPYHSTVTGTTGKYLAAELSRQQTAFAEKRDLLGHRSSKWIEEGATMMDQQPSTLPLAAILDIRRSNAHLVRRTSIGPSGSTAAEFDRNGDCLDTDDDEQLKTGRSQKYNASSSTAAFFGSSPQQQQQQCQNGSGTGLEQLLHGRNFVSKDLDHFQGTLLASPDQLAEWRHRVIAGLMRYFHSKRTEGLLSTQSLRILEWACERELDDSKHTSCRNNGEDNSSKSRPLSVWKTLEGEIKSSWFIRALALFLFFNVQAFSASPRWLQKITSWPFKKTTGFLLGFIGSKLLIACEVSVEYYMALLHSHHVHWARTHEEAWQLASEIEAEAEAARKFIMQREIEAPDRFNSIQSYRAAIAVLRRQAAFVQELYETGMLDSNEREKMMGPLDKKMRRLEITGPVWRPPRAIHVLKAMPAMSKLPRDFFTKVQSMLRFVGFETGSQIWSSDEPLDSSCIYVVVLGIIRRTVTNINDDSYSRDYYHGTGGMIGVLKSMTGLILPDVKEVVVTEGNSLGKGAALYRFPPHFDRWLDSEIARGVPGGLMLKEELLKLAGMYVITNTEARVLKQVAKHVLRLIKIFQGMATSGNTTTTTTTTTTSSTLPVLPPQSPLPSMTTPTATGMLSTSTTAKQSVEMSLVSVPSAVARLLDEDEGIIRVQKEGGRDQRQSQREEKEKEMEQLQEPEQEQYKTDKTTIIPRPAAASLPPGPMIDKATVPSILTIKAETAEVMTELKSVFSASKICIMGPLASFSQKCHIVLLKGQLICDNVDVDGNGNNGDHLKKRYHAPCVLTWLWKPHLACTNRHCPPDKVVELCSNQSRVLRAGIGMEEGATILICGSSDVISETLEAIQTSSKAHEDEIAACFATDDDNNDSPTSSSRGGDVGMKPLRKPLSTRARVGEMGREFNKMFKKVKARSIVD
jgi:NhaP-type Na+/H+ or K+/H+ antiporter